MDAAESGEPAAEGQDGKQDVSDDSDSGQVIIELDHSQIASPSDSEEEKHPQESPKKQGKSCNETESADAMSDTDDRPDENAELAQSKEDDRPDENAELAQSKEDDHPDENVELAQSKEDDRPDENAELAQSKEDDHPDENVELAQSKEDDHPDENVELAQSKESVADESAGTAAHHHVKSVHDKVQQKDEEGCLSWSSEAVSVSAAHEDCRMDDSVKHKEQNVDSDSVRNSGAADSAVKDSLVLENMAQLEVDAQPSQEADVVPSQTDAIQLPSQAVEVPSRADVPSQIDRTEDVTLAKEASTVSESGDMIEKQGMQSMDKEEPGVAVGEVSPKAAVTADPESGKEPAKEESPEVKTTDLFAIADDVSDVSSEGEAPLSPVEEEDKPSAEKLSKEAAHQAEALAPLGAEPVSEPESGEDMGSDESSPLHSPCYRSPIVVTSTSRISLGSGDYADVRARATSHSPRKSDSAIISDSASSIHPPDRSDRLSLEDGIIPSALSASDNKLDLSASMDMENISDDENIGEDNDSEDTSGEIEDEPEEGKAEETVSSSTHQAEEEVQKVEEKSLDGEHARRPIMIASLGDKQQVQTHFSEEQVELDYEDVDGEGDADEGEIKGDDEEDGKEEEDSDKDEGEIDDDDDCEEGEIKEPGGTKKPFVKPICRFFLRGTCTWGLNCRFLHPGINDKGNYQMIELPGQRWNGPGGIGGTPWAPEPPEEPVELPPPPEVPPVESAWERGLRHAKEQIKKASQRKEQESNFEEKRLNLSVDEEREMNKENERRMVVHVPIVKDPYYDQAAFDEEEYYKQRGINPWQSGRYENFEVRYNREYSPYREKEYYPPPLDRYPRHFSPPVDKFGRHPRMETRPDPPYRPNRMEEMRAMSPSPPVPAASPPPYRRPADEWHDPWRRSAKSRSKSPKANRRGRSRSRSRRGRRSLSDSSVSSEQKKKKTRPAAPVKHASSRSGSRSSGSHSSRSRSYSSGSSRSRSRSSEPAPPGVERGGDRKFGPPQGRFMDGPRSAVSVRGRDRGGHWRGQDAAKPGGYNRNRDGGGFQRGHHHDRHRQSGPSSKPAERSFPPGYGYNRPPPGQGRPPERRLPTDAMRPKKTHSVSSSGSSRSRSRSRSRSGSRSGSSSSFSRSRSGSARSRSPGSGSRSRSASSMSSHTSSSSSSSSGSADSDNLYRDLGGPSPKKKTVKDRHKDKEPGKPPRQVDPSATVKDKEKEKDAGKPPRHMGPVASMKDKEKEKDAGKPPRHMGPVASAPRGERKHPGNPPPRRPGQPPPAPPDHGPRPPRSDLRPDGRADRPPPDVRHDGRLDRGNAERMDPPGRGVRPERPNKVDRPDRSERPDRPQRPERAERPERMDRDRGENRSDRGDRGDRAERDRGAAVGKPVREQSSRPPPPSLQPKAKDPMKLIGLKSNIKLSLVSKPGDKSAAAAGAVASPLKRRPPEGGEGGPPAKRPALPPSPVKMPSEKAAKPLAGRERARSPSERQPRSGSAAMPASLPAAMAASIPLPPSPSKAPSTKPRPPPAKPHPPPSAGSKAPPPQPAAPPSAVPPPSGPPAAAPVPKAKKSTTSRREELLKQLKAVEDAIARKKAKMQ